MYPEHDWDREKTQILASNTAQGVHKHLRILESNRSRVLPRWIWELLQNARDVSAGDASLVASVKVRDRALTFCHNGRGFEPDEITHLVYYGSTKLESAGALGQFGSGFLTTHLLALTIEVSGQLADGQTFAFELDRSGESVADLQRSMDASFEAFKSSLAPAGDGADQGATTTFRYPLGHTSLDVVQQGMQALELSGSYVTAFNQEFKRIQILTPESQIVLELKQRRVLAEQIAEVEVDISSRDNAPPELRSHVVAETKGVTVGVRLKRRDGDVALESPTRLPKLFLGFPLIGTEDFSLPVVVHSLRFSPTEERDGVYLGQSNDQVNQENQSVLEQACRLLLTIARFAAESGWSCIHVLAEVPPVSAQRWLDQAWLRNCLRTQLVEPIRATPTVLNESGKAIAPNGSTLPTADSPEAVDRLWSLAFTMTNLKDTLPKQAEAQGWCSATRSWAALYDCHLGELNETMDGRDLAGNAEAAGSIKTLQAQLGDADAVSWLDELHRFLSTNGFDAALRGLKIVPDQNGEFDTLQNLHRDLDIPDELKDIAQLVGWNLRAKLRDTRFGTLSDEPGAGALDSDFIISKLINRLRERMEKPLDDDTKAANVRLFGWITSQGQWRYIDGFPAFSDEGTLSSPMTLRQHEDDASDRPLAPVRTWPAAVRAYAELFPRRHILAEEFATGLDCPSVWSTLDQRGFLRTSVLHTRNVRFDQFLPDEPLPDEGEGESEHKVDGKVEVTDIAFLTMRDIGVLSRVRQSRKQAQLFWDLLTGWLAVEDAHGLKALESKCVCGSRHRYYPAAWLVPLVRNQWVPLERRRTGHATAHSLANLVRESKWSEDVLRMSPQTVTLLKALGVAVPELIMEIFTTDEQERTALDEALAHLLTSVGSDWDRLIVLAKDIQEDGAIFDHLEERRQRRRMVIENQRLGARVEELVRESLEVKGFHVQRTSVGSDFAILPRPTADDEQIRLKLIREGQAWLVEIKSARGDSVRMTSVQARTSVQYDSRYLLCVVPISNGPEDPDKEAVRQRMRFVGGIGARLAEICDALDNYEIFRDRITVEDATGLGLELDSGSPRIRIERKVWEKGFGLQDLFSRLNAGHASDAF